MNLFYDFINEMDVNNPGFDNKSRVHDWRNYVPYEWQKEWDNFTERERKIIINMAEIRAEKEEWD